MRLRGPTRPGRLAGSLQGRSSAPSRPTWPKLCLSESAKQSARRPTVYAYALPPMDVSGEVGGIWWLSDPARKLHQRSTQRWLRRTGRVWSREYMVFREGASLVYLLVSLVSVYRLGDSWEQQSRTRRLWCDRKIENVNLRPSEIFRALSGNRTKTQVN